jgi:hypothetical protein
MPVDQTPDIDFTVDRNNLYLEEGFTDMKVASIRRMTPVKPDGSPDPGRQTVFIGQTQLMTPDGPLPIQNKLAAATLTEAIDKFPAAMANAMQHVIQELRRMEQMHQQEKQQQQKDSRIIVPGR